MSSTMSDTPVSTPSVENNSPVPQPATPDNTFPAPPTTASDEAARQPPRRKPSRRANTAERRATHNAVERQRRETLNGRFLDLAALLPNLASVRRPSKSAIVNSSIALIHSQRRLRAIAAHELRMLKAETDALRREVNDWRERTRSGPRVEEPVRTPEFVALINLEDVTEENEDERRAYAMRDTIIEDGEDDYIGDGYEEDVRAPAYTSAPIPIPGAAPVMTATDPRFEYTTPAMPQHDKMAAWNAHIYNAFAQSQWASQQQQQQQAYAAAQQSQVHAAHLQAQAAQVQAQQAQVAAAHAALFTPPGSAHGTHSPVAVSPFAHAPTDGRSPITAMFPSYPSAPPASAHSVGSSVGLIDDDGTSSVGSYHETQTPPRGSPPTHSPINTVFGGASPFGAEVNGASATSAEAFAAAFHQYPRTVSADWTGANKGQLAAMGLIM